MLTNIHKTEVKELVQVLPEKDLVKRSCIDKEHLNRDSSYFHKEIKNKANETSSTYRKVSYFIASGLHFVAALSKFLGISEDQQKKLTASL